MFRPPINRAMRTLDRAFFRRTFPISAARVTNNNDISMVRKALEKSQDILVQPRYQAVWSDPAQPGKRLVLLKPEIKHNDPSTWGPQVTEFQDANITTLVPHDVTLDYDYWTYDDIMKSILPEENQEDLYPKRFTQVGHILHLNLRESHQPYKQLIADVLFDKTKNIKTIISKIDNVGEESQFRTFAYEVLKGPDDLNVEVHEEGCTFCFDFAKVYWNSRLQAEHKRLVSTFKEGDAVCDVMAGIGPFAVPAGKKKVFVRANDLNPESYKYMVDAIKKNHVGPWVAPHNENGHKFIRTATAELYAHPRQHSQLIAHKYKPGEKKPANPPKPEEKRYTEPKIFSHYVMNLPASAIEFLPAFIGLYSRHPFKKLLKGAAPETLFSPHTPFKLPMIHVYCFERKGGDVVAEQSADVCKRISEQLDYVITPDTPDVSIYDVRDVAPNKRMFCASFRLPAEVAFRPQRPRSQEGTFEVD
ncbi:uncharacterized protein K452DRAFT_230371 [Aplosporella prunicola CBS 121167]|uniref:tRNA (guanine(37)-N1)-methyltransferase n=1 Tax=Aplosporella prunicola CBS 121167 TaxID=1176127 RepID=A0A6A6BBI5_9PEZI|nr:uncharacterized protein K452DRAFT_230371 [Aplosporella prunicola CBS 121167]KAF2140595.1 hypothetical protein K452DRAFT_230371 [Aplosporella prunicola CBS 121167]